MQLKKCTEAQEYPDNGMEPQEQGADHAGT